MPAGAEERDLTEEGALVGTLRYMSPEQAAGGAVTPASDMYSFGVLLQEMLTGRNAYDGATPLEVLRRVLEAETVEPAGLPPDLAELVRDLTRLQPGARPDADDCRRRLDWILSAPRRRRDRRRRLLIAAAMTAAVAAAGLGGLLVQRERPRCRGAEQRLAGVWDTSRRTALEQSFHTAGELAALPAVTRRLDEVAAAWVTMRTEACEATWTHGEQSAELLDLRMACLDIRLEEMGALVDVLQEDPAGIGDLAAQAAYSLTPVDVCADARTLLARVPPPVDPGVRQAVDGARRELARAKALLDAGRWQDAADLLGPLGARADELAYPPLVGESRLLRGLVEEKLGRPAEAEFALVQAIWAAEAGRDDRTAASAWVRRVWLAGGLRSEFERVDELEGHARAALARLGGDAELEGALANHLGVVAARQGRLEDAWTLFQRALELRRSAFGGEHPLVASTLGNLAFVAEDLGRVEEALEHGRGALEMRVRTLGPDHPAILDGLVNLALMSDNAGLLGEREVLLERAIQVAQTAVPEGHPAVAALLNNLANWEMGAGRFGEAVRLAGRAAGIFSAAFGENDLATADARLNEGLSALQTGDPARALAACASARSVFAAQPAPSHRDVFQASVCEGAALDATGRRDEAVTLLEELLARGEPDTADARLALARLKLDLARLLGGSDRQRADLLVAAVAGDLAGGRVEDAELAAEVAAWRRSRDGG